ncbi:hypothetical protein ACHAQA_002929 [Verticillium albo-atrum]
MKVITLLSAAGLVASSTTEPGPQVDLGYSIYEGLTYGNGVNAFLGMRYATAPIGRNRLRVPQKPTSGNRSGVVSAKGHGPICFGVQELAFPPAPLPASEDCLFLDVYAPAHVEGDGVPVMVWIQGGAFVNLYNPNYNGSGLVEASNNNAVIVTFNYRVGPQGFLASQALQDEGNLNLGLHDQRMAISWVEENISKFGGDPRKVTLFGTSIGAGSVLLHTMAYGGQASAAQELNWHAGIATAVNIPSVYQVKDLENQYKEFLRRAGCDSLACLRELSTEEFQAANIGRPQIEGAPSLPLFPYGPVIDGILLPDTPSILAAAGNFSKSRPLIVGSGQSEGTVFAPQANTIQEVDGFLAAQFPLLTSDDLNKAQTLYVDIPSTYPGVTASHSPYFYRASAMYGDAAFSCPTLDVATSMRNAGANIHLLRNVIVDPAEQAAGFLTPHTWEVEAVWGPGYAASFVALPSALSYHKGGMNHEMVGVVQSYWLNFASSLGAPEAGKCLPRWSTFNENNERLRLATGDTGMEIIEAREMERCRFWRSVAEKTRI